MIYESAQDLFDALSAPFPPEEIKWRVGSTNADKSKGLALAYIDARCVMDRLDSTCGPDNWSNSFEQFGPTMVCKIGVRVNNEWLWKADGAGTTDVEGEKGILSDAFKRAAVHWGIGRYLYGMKAPWVAITQRGKSSVIADSEVENLDKIHEEHARKCGWGNPTDVAAYRFLLKVVHETVTQPSDVDPFRERHKGMIPLLRVAQRQHLNRELDRIGAHREAAE